jgi:OOP family OmpA-OmpF porin
MFKKIALVLLALLFATTSAMAEGFYAGAGMGITQIEDEDEGVTFEDSPFGWKVFAGYDFNENFAVEGAYLNSGEAEDDLFGENVKAELTAFAVSAIGLMPVGDSAHIFGKVGYYDGEQEIKAFGLTVTEDDDGLTVGGGIRFKTAKNFALRADFDWFDTTVDTVWSIGVGIQFYFGQ